MNDQFKSKEELITELRVLRGQVSRLEEKLNQRSRIEEALKDSESRYRTLMANIPDFIFSIDESGTVSNFNIPSSGLAGWTPEDIIGQDFSFIIHPEDREKVQTAFRKTIKKGREWTRGFQFRILTKKGDVRWMDMNAHAQYDEQGRFLREEGVLRDITKRKKAEQSTRDNLHFLQSLDRVNRIIRNAGDLENLMKKVLETVLSIFDSDRTWLLYPCDPKAEFWSIPLECSKPEYPGAMVLNQSIPMTNRIAHIIQHMLESDEPQTIINSPGGFEWDPDDTYQIRSLVSMAIFPKIGSPWGFGMHQCSYERHWTEEELRLFKEIGHRMGDALSSLLFFRNIRESEEKYRLLVENANDAIFITQDGWIKFLNRRTAALLGSSADELDESLLLDLVHPDDRGQAVRWGEMEYLPETDSGSRPFRMRNSNGNQLWVKLNVVPITWQNQPAVLNFLRDVTSERKLESQLQQSRKMEAIGTLAGGIAHDFNNILQAISGYVQLFETKSDGDARNREYLAEVDRAVERASDLIQRLLTFSRKVESHFRPVDLNQVIAQTVKILERTIPKMIKMETSLAEDLKNIKADPVQIERILFNLGANARDAMPDGGLLMIKTENVYLGDLDCKELVGISPGLFVSLRVTDTGHGMDQETAHRIFDPFFTTKEVGRGTGLGMSTVYGIVKNHGGHITCYSEPGKGTVVNIYFPVNENQEKIVIETEKMYDVSRLRGTETILLVDDERAILETAQETLETNGYRVMVADSGERALELFGEADRGIDLVIMDLLMPGMGGYICLKKLLNINPGVKVIIASGYSTHPHINESLEAGAKGFIGKPYRLLDMLREIRGVLD